MDLTCPVCSRPKMVLRAGNLTDFEFRLPSRSQLFGCDGCGVHVLKPVPPPETAYPEDYAPGREGGSRLRNAIFCRYHEWEARRMSRRFPKGGRLLDVGCGDGGFLRALKRVPGWEVEGLEWDRRAVEMARKSGLQVEQGDITVTHLPASTYDFIRLNHALEHVCDPAGVLHRLRVALRPGGFLMGETPNIDCLDFRMFRRYWGGLHYPRHPWLFTRESLRRVVESQGLSLLSVKNCYRTVGWSRAFQNIIDEKLALDPAPDAWRPWYPALIVLCLPITFLQAALAKTGVMEFWCQSPSSEIHA